MSVFFELNILVYAQQNGAEADKARSLFASGGILSADVWRKSFSAGGSCEVAVLDLAQESHERSPRKAPWFMLAMAAPGWGYEAAAPNSPQQFADFIAADTAKWRNLANTINIKAN